MKLLVTGGAGFIGSHVVVRLLKAGHDVVIYDNLSRGLKSNVPSGARFVLGDVRDHDLVSRVLKDAGAEAVLHFAAKISVPESIEKPFDYIENNLEGGLCLLRACRARGVNRFVFSSTAAVYGEFNSGGNVKETEPLRPSNPYGETKAQFESALSALHRERPEFKYLSLRYFNVAGATVEEKRGPLTENSTHLMTVAAQAALGLRPYVEIYGDDYPTADGTCVRDYVHVADLADLHLLGLGALVEGRVEGPLNCGYGRGASVKSVIQEMKSVSKRDFEVRTAPRRQGDVSSMVADTTLLNSKIDWKPRHDSLTEMCRSTLEWVRMSSASRP